MNTKHLFLFVRTQKILFFLRAIVVFSIKKIFIPQVHFQTFSSQVFSCIGVLVKTPGFQSSNSIGLSGAWGVCTFTPQGILTQTHQGPHLRNILLYKIIEEPFFLSPGDSIFNIPIALILLIGFEVDVLFLATRALQWQKAITEPYSD